MCQRFPARESFLFDNGAIGYRPGRHLDILGPYAKVKNCPVYEDGVLIGRYTCYATAYADSFFSIPACTRIKGKYIKGYFTESVEFRYRTKE